MGFREFLLEGDGLKGRTWKVVNKTISDLKKDITRIKSIQKGLTIYFKDSDVLTKFETDFEKKISSEFKHGFESQHNRWIVSDNDDYEENGYEFEFYIVYDDENPSKLNFANIVLP